MSERDSSKNKVVPTKSLGKTKVLPTVTLKKIKVVPMESLEKALENKKYNWRTINAITKEIEIPKVEVIKLIENMEDTRIIIKGTRVIDNEDIYTTRKHYKEKSSLLTRVKDVARGKVVR